MSDNEKHRFTFLNIIFTDILGHWEITWERVRIQFDMRLNTRRPTWGDKYMHFFHVITSCIIKTPVLYTINQQIYYSKDHFTQKSWWFFFFLLKIKTSKKKKKILQHIEKIKVIKCANVTVTTPAEGTVLCFHSDITAHMTTAAGD